MKKLLSIALLAVFLFNVGGYYMVFWALRIHADQQMNLRIERNQYDAGETIEIKIPVALPYPIHSQGFQRADGRFEHQGEFFKLVKHKYQNDTLYIVCIRDQATRELVNTMKDYAELAQSLPPTGQKAWSFLSKLIKDYCSGESVTLSLAFRMYALQPHADDQPFFLQPLIPVHAPPPRS